MTTLNHTRGRTILGIFLIAIGTIFIINNLALFQLPFKLFSWQTLLLVVGAIFIITKNNSSMGFVLILIAIVGFTAEYFGTSFKYIISEYWPFILILLGISIIFKPKSVSLDENKENMNSDNSIIDNFLFFQSQRINVASSKFLGGKFTTIFSSLDLDLTAAQFENTPIIDSLTVFGGTEIFVPKDCKVVFNATTIFGGFEDKRYYNEFEGENTIIIKGLVLFGGIEIK